MKPPISVGAFRKLVKELAATERRPLAIGGADEPARTLERELTRGGDASAVRIGAPGGAAVYVHIGRDDGALRAARKARVPSVAVTFDGEDDMPYVYATDVVRVGPGGALPVEQIVKAVAARLGETGAPLAARLPVLRGAVCDAIVASCSRKNGIVGAAVFVPGADLPVLALNQVRMLLLLHQAWGVDLGARETQVRSALAAVGAGFGLRAVARELLDFVPVAGWAVKGGVAYAGTRALGEAAIRRLEASRRTKPSPGP